MRALFSKLKRAVLHAVRNAVGVVTPSLAYAPPNGPQPRQRILVLGVYLSDENNTVAHLVSEFGRSRHHTVVQGWARLGRAEPAIEVERVTRLSSVEMVQKFILLNRLLALHDLNQFDHVIFTDDDVRLRRGFVDTYIGLQNRCLLALSQPARTTLSYISYVESRRLHSARVRETNFVEIGPVFCVSRAAFSHLLPFDESSGMGYGYDMVWPRRMQAARLRMGTMDGCPIDHTIRRIGKTYSQNMHMQSMQTFLEKNPHMRLEEALKRNEIIF